MSLSVDYFVCCYLYVSVVNLIDYSDIDKKNGHKQWKMLIMRLKSSNKSIKSSLYV